ncbi:hypothetical protein ACGGAQ_20845 [Micromonospora sp. NPDC047557]|uniref:hypothetical protein n=1 Tax=Micromonospora sp. NPDC047557 TaxID=3364250 RepID=UPI00371F7FF2
MTKWRRTVRRGSVPVLALSLAMGGAVPAAATPQPGGDRSGDRPPTGALSGERTVPVMAVRSTAALDGQNAAPAGQQFRFPVTVQRQTGAPRATTVGLTLDVSYDGGHTWQPARLVRSGNTWTATVDHPAGHGFASLRAFAVDSAGNTVRQTIVNAYRLKG